jgi:hypothetical protein
MAIVPAVNADVDVQPPVVIDASDWNWDGVATRLMLRVYWEASDEPEAVKRRLHEFAALADRIDRTRGGEGFRLSSETDEEGLLTLEMKPIGEANADERICAVAEEINEGRPKNDRLTTVCAE